MDLPQKQSDAFEQMAILSDGGEFAHSTLTALEKKGLIVGYDEVVYGPTMAPIDRIPMTIRKYYVPLVVHAAWCQWCSEQPD